jgi:hypothetical protein
MCNRALAGKVVYALHKKYVEEANNDSINESTVGIYSTAKAARAALRTTMMKDVFDTEDLPKPTWADFYVGEDKGQKMAIKRLQNGEPDAEDEFEFPWDEPWRSDGTIAFHVCNLMRNNDDDETGSEISDEDGSDEEDDEEASSEDDPLLSADEEDAWVCEDADDGHYYEIEAILIR